MGPTELSMWVPQVSQFGSPQHLNVGPNGRSIWDNHVEVSFRTFVAHYIIQASLQVSFTRRSLSHIHRTLSTYVGLFLHPALWQSLQLKRLFWSLFTHI